MSHNAETFRQGLKDTLVGAALTVFILALVLLTELKVAFLAPLTPVSTLSVSDTSLVRARLLL